MRLVRLLLKRIAVGLFTTWAVLSGIFVLVVGAKKWHLNSIIAVDVFNAQRSRAETDPEEFEQTAESYLAERGLDQPIGDLYIEWIVNMFTFQWGESFASGRDALYMVGAGTTRTVVYVLPAVALAGVVGLLVGLLFAMKQHARGEGTVRGLTYLGMGLPNFWVAALLLVAASATRLVFQPAHQFSRNEGIPEIVILEYPFLYEYLLPVLFVALPLAVAMVSYARAYSLQIYSDDLTKHVRAKGGGELAVAKHVFRNSAVPLVSMLFAETFALLTISVFVVEAVFAIDGIASLLYNAIWRQDLPLVMGCSMVFVVFGVAGNMLQDLLHSLVDPRVGTDSL